MTCWQHRQQAWCVRLLPKAIPLLFSSSFGDFSSCTWHVHGWRSCRGGQHSLFSLSTVPDAESPPQLSETPQADALHPNGKHRIQGSSSLLAQALLCRPTSERSEAQRPSRRSFNSFGAASAVRSLLFPTFCWFRWTKLLGAKSLAVVHRGTCLWLESAAKASVNSTYRMKLAGEPLNFPSSSKVLSK